MGNDFCSKPGAMRHSRRHHVSEVARERRQRIKELRELDSLLGFEGFWDDIDKPRAHYAITNTAEFYDALKDIGRGRRDILSYHGVTGHNLEALALAQLKHDRGERVTPGEILDAGPKGVRRELKNYRTPGIAVKENFGYRRS